MRFVILGGSASATPELADALANWPGGAERRPSLEVVLHGRSAERLELVASEMRRRVTDIAGPSVSVRTETDLAAALEGADVVLDAVRIGGLAARVFDESYPQRHGCPGEETMGPGGLANALRTVPVVRAFWAKVREVAPDALHINLTNPSGIVVAALEREFGGRVFSVCDSPITFCDAIADRLGLLASEVRLRYQGMNHLGWWLPRDPEDLQKTIDLATGVVPEAVEALGAIAHESRLQIFRYLVESGPEGMAAGRIGERLSMPAATLSFHLNHMKQAGMIQPRREGRSIIYSANYNAMNQLLSYLTEKCCGGDTCSIAVNSNIKRGK